MKKFLLAAPLALAAGAVLATPASAAPFNNAGQIRSEIAQLDRQVGRTPGLTRSETQRLERQVDQLQDLYQRYARGGFTRNELQTLGSRVDAAKSQLFARGHDRNDRFDRNGRDNHGGHRR